MPREEAGDVSSHEHQYGKAWIERWREAMRWRRRVELELAPLGVSFAQWLALDCIAALYAELSDAVSQIQIGTRLELGRAATSELMQRLELLGLIDRAPAFESRENRIYLTPRGKHLAAGGRGVVDRVSVQHGSS